MEAFSPIPGLLSMCVVALIRWRGGGRVLYSVLPGSKIPERGPKPIVVAIKFVWKRLETTEQMVQVHNILQLGLSWLPNVSRKLFGLDLRG
jgi:hypothetical protein